MTDTMHESEARVIFDKCKELLSTETLQIGEYKHIIVTPDGRTVQSLEPFLDEVRERPRRHKGFAELTTIKSFARHCMRYRHKHSVVFVDDSAPGAPSMRAIFNYHEDESDDAPPGLPAFCDYGAVYRFPVSDEWQAWWAADGESMTQEKFAEFLEDQIADVIEPTKADDVCKALAQKLGLEPASPSRLLALSRGLTVHVGHKVAEHRNLATGEAQVSFETTHKDEGGEQLRIPGLFAIAIPVFKRESPTVMPVRLRYRVRSGQIVWTVKIHGADAAMRRALDGAVSGVTEALKPTSVFWGKHSTS